MTTRRRHGLNPFAMVAALLGAAAFAAALALKLIQVGRAPADYYGVLIWLAPEIGLAPFVGLIGWVAVILANAACDKRSARIGLLGCGLAAAAFLLTLMYPPQNARDLNGRCMENVRTISRALTMYAAEHGAFPPAAHWRQALSGYVRDPTVWREPFTGKPGYALNAAIAGRRPNSFAADPSNIVAVYESDRGADAAGGPELLRRRPLHYDGYVIGFLDGHIRWVRGQPANQTLVWNPDTAAAAAPKVGHAAKKR